MAALIYNIVMVAVGYAQKVGKQFILTLLEAEEIGRDGLVIS